MAPEEVASVETEVNRRLIANSHVSTTVTSKDEAQEMGALAFFGDKYGETVRVVQIGDFSTEFCGGTHTSSAGEVGPLLLLSESSIGSNLRRVEALTGMFAYDHLVEMRSGLDDVGKMLKASPPEVPARVQGLIDKVEFLEEELAGIRSQRRGELAGEIASGAVKLGDVAYVIADGKGLSGNELRHLALDIRDRIDGSSVVVMGSNHAGKGALVGLVTADLVERGVSAADLIRGGARELGGGGSSDPELAQAGGPNGKNLPAALAVTSEVVGKSLSDL
jgi:alanyl-tRNA synthetase